MTTKEAVSAHTPSIHRTESQSVTNRYVVEVYPNRRTEFLDYLENAFGITYQGEELGSTFLLDLSPEQVELLKLHEMVESVEPNRGEYITSED